jgi:ATP-dependent Clp protease ATP-binding subunit ClpB
MEGTTLHLERYTEDSKSIISGAQKLADDKHHAEVGMIHLLAYALEHDSSVQENISKIADVKVVLAQVNSLLLKQRQAPNALSTISAELLALFGRAEKATNGLVSGETLLITIVGDASNKQVASILAANKITVEALTKAEKEKTASFKRDMVAQAKRQHDPIIGRDGEVRRLLQILGRRQKNNALLVGESGVGKKTIVHSLANRLAKNDVPHKASFPLYEVDLTAIQAGLKGRSETDERLKKVLSIKDNAVMFLHGIENLFVGQGSNTTSDILKHAMKKGCRIIATTSTTGKKALEKDPGLMHLFSLVQVEPASVDQTKEILRGVAKRYEEHHGVSIGENSIASAVRLAKRYLKDRSLPASAIDLLDEAASRKRLEMGSLPSNIDDAQRRLVSLETQLSALSNKADSDSQKVVRNINTEMERLIPSIDEMKQKATMTYISRATVNELKGKYAEMAGQKTKAEVMGDTELTARLGAELPELKAKLEAAESALTNAKDDEVSNAVSEENVARVLQDWTGVNASKMLESETEKLLGMEKRLSMRVFGQDEALQVLSRAIRRSRLGLHDPKKPVGSFLFLGSSGTGKTETAKGLAEFLFDDEKNFLRLDMSEYREAHQAQKLLGSPPGYVNSDGGGLLTNHIDKYPTSVVLADEVEKGHGAVLDLFLQILDDSRLTSGTGKTSFFNDSVIIMTSNIGTRDLLDASEKTPEKFETEEGREELTLMVREKLKEHMRPEFINRIDNIVLFQPLSRQHLVGVVDIQVRAIEKLLEHRELHLTLTQAAKEEIVERSWEPAFGARPTLRSMSKYIKDPLAEELLRGGYQPGDTISVDYDGSAFTFSNSRIPAPPPSRVEIDVVSEEIEESVEEAEGTE